MMSMRNAWNMLATFVLVTALAASGYAGPGNGNGGNGNGNGKPKKEKKEKPEKPGKPPKPPKPPKPEHPGKPPKPPKPPKPEHPGKPSKDNGTSATFAIDQVLVSDDRILDLTGDYVLSGTVVTGPATTGTATATVSLLQDDRGRLIGPALVSLPDGTTTEITVSGHLQLTGQTNLRVQLAGAIGATLDDDSVIDDDDDLLDDSDSSASISIRGNWDGTAFQTVVTIKYLDSSYSFDATIVPVNPLRGFIVESPTSSQVKGKKTWENRNVVLPWGDEQVRSQMSNKKGFTFMMHSGDFGLDLRGSVDTSATVSLSRAKVHLGYGSLEVDPDTVTVVPAVTVPVP